MRSPRPCWKRADIPQGWYDCVWDKSGDEVQSASGDGAEIRRPRLLRSGTRAADRGRWGPGRCGDSPSLSDHGLAGARFGYAIYRDGEPIGGARQRRVSAGRLTVCRAVTRLATWHGTGEALGLRKVYSKGRGLILGGGYEAPRYWRLQAELPDSNIAMGDPSDANIACLMEAASSLVSRDHARSARMCSRLAGS